MRLRMCRLCGMGMRERMCWCRCRCRSMCWRWLARQRRHRHALLERAWGLLAKGSRRWGLAQGAGRAQRGWRLRAGRVAAVVGRWRRCRAWAALCVGPVVLLGRCRGALLLLVVRLEGRAGPRRGRVGCGVLLLHLLLLMLMLELLLVQLMLLLLLLLVVLVLLLLQHLLPLPLPLPLLPLLLLLLLHVRRRRRSVCWALRIAVSSHVSWVSGISWISRVLVLTRILPLNRAGHLRRLWRKRIARRASGRRG